MPEDTPQGQAALDALSDELERLSVVPDHRPRYNVTRVVGAMAPLVASLSADLESVLVEPYKAHVAGPLRETVGRLPVVSEAVIFAFNQDQRDNLPGRPHYRALIREANEHQRAGRQMLHTLEGIGLVSQERSRQIRRGSGHADLAGDLQTLGAMGKAHWGVLEALQSHQPDPALRMDQGRLERMIALGSEIIQADKNLSDAPDVDWRKMLIDTAALLDKDWDFILEVATTAYRLADRHEDAEALVSLHTLSRR